MKRLVSILLSLTLILVFLAACNKNTGDNSQNESSIIENSQTESSIIESSTDESLQSESTESESSESSEDEIIEPIWDTEPINYLDYEGHHFRGSIDTELLFHQEGFVAPQYFIFREYSEFSEAREEYKFTGTDFNGFADEIDESFFGEKAIILIPRGLSSGSISLTFDYFSIEDNVLNVSFNHCTPEVCDCAIQFLLMTAVVDKEDISEVNEINFIDKEQQRIDKYFSVENCNNQVDFDYSIISGTFGDYDTTNNFNSGYGWVHVANDKYQWDSIFEKCVSDDDELGKLSEKFTEEFFKEKSVILLPMENIYTGVDYSITSITSGEGKIEFEILTDESKITDTHKESKLIFIVINKNHFFKDSLYYLRFTVNKLEKSE